MTSTTYRHGIARVIRGVLVLWMLVGSLAAMARQDDCEIVLGAAQVDYGPLSRATMMNVSGGELRLPPRTIDMTVRCAQPHDMSLVLRTRAADREAFRFAEHARFAARLSHGMLDGRPVRLGERNGRGGTPVETGASLPWRPDRALAPVDQGRAMVGKVFSVRMAIDAYLDDRALQVSDATHWLVDATIGMIDDEAAAALTLRAEAVAGRCHVDVARHITFGRLHSTDLGARGESTRIPAAQPGLLQVVCDAPMAFAFRIARDERSGTAVLSGSARAAHRDGQLFGLGKTRTNQPIGAYVLRWHGQAVSDRGELALTRSTDDGRSWGPAAGDVLAVHDGLERVAYALAGNPATGPVPVTTLSVALDATIYIAPQEILSLSDTVEADGRVTFEIIY